MSMQTPLNKVRGFGSARSGTEHWWLQRVTAIANTVLAVFFIFLVISLVGESYQEVTATLASPLIAIAMLALILSVTWHMRLGMQVIIEDYVHGEGSKIALLLANTFFCAAMAIAAIFAILNLSLGA
jgi:succinate dehydrogenase / fumarate reductase membrane anchor subunit